MTRLTRTIMAVIATGILTTACGSAGDSAGRNGSPSGADTPAGSSAEPDDSGLGGEAGEGRLGPAPLRPGDPPNCRAGAMRAAFEVTGGGMGKRFGTIRLTNTSTERCSLSGPVELALAERSGRALPSRVKKAAGDRISVRPGESAWLVVSWTVIPGEGETGVPCQPKAASIAVTVPDAGGPVTASFTGGSVCNQGAMGVGAPTLIRPTA